MAFVSVNAKIATDSSGAFVNVRVLLTSQGVVRPLLDYCLSRSHDRGRSWQKKMVQAAELFMRYALANPDEPLSKQLFRNFAQRLYSGTFDLEIGLDASNLCWRPLSYSNAGAIIVRLSEFFEWLGQDYPDAGHLNPKYEGSAYDRSLAKAAYAYRRNSAFLGHIWSINPKSPSRYEISPKRRTDSYGVLENPPAFPDNRFEELLFRGFKVGGKLDYRGMLISLLMHGGGLRVSEPFHLYVQDVFPSPNNKNCATVLVHHPYLGAAPRETGVSERSNQRNRATYLADQFGLVPRISMLDNRAAGWKDPRADGHHYMHVYWFEPEFGEIFLQIWYRYLEQLAQVERNHPFAFVNLHREPIGGMYTIDKFIEAHRAAVERIGLVSSRTAGTVRHSHRHAYGRRLKNAGLDDLIIQRCMHHRAIESQRVYTGPTSSEITTALVNAGMKLTASVKSFG